MKNISEILTIDELRLDLHTKGFDLNASPVDVEAIAAIYGIEIDDAPRIECSDKLGSVDGLKIWVNPIDANEYTSRKTLRLMGGKRLAMILRQTS